MAACYHGASDLPTCSIRCSDGCPDGTSCVAGYCTNGNDCAAPVDAPTADTSTDGPPDAPSCGLIGLSCCASGTACGDGLTCASGTCTQCVTEISFGQAHSCVLEHDHTVHCVGQGTNGQLGNNAIVNSPTYVQVADAAGPITNAMQIGAGFTFNCAVRSDTTVWCWGYGYWGQLGTGAYSDSPIAVQVTKTDTTALTDIVEVHAGGMHACARSNAGNIWCWGYSYDGELGDNTTTYRPTASQVTHGGVALTGAATLGVGYAHSCMLDNTGQVWCWGANTDGRVGDGTVTNVMEAKVVATGAEVAVGRRHTCVRQATGAVSCWGDNRGGQLGDGTTTNSSTAKAVVTSVGGGAFSSAASIAAGRVSCAVTTEGAPVCWGGDAHGSGRGSPTPVPVSTLGAPLTGVDRLALGFTHACAHTSAGAWWCWGRDTEGELGDGATLGKGYAIPLSATCQ
jgi:alpha-tubulin suppressor-like RCC1 family protein